MSRNQNRAEQIIGLLDSLSLELKDLVTDHNRSAKSRIEDIRTEMGFEKGGYVGHKTLETLMEEGAFEEMDEEEEDE